MIRDLGIVQPGTLLYIPFHTFDSNDPSASVTLTGLAATDIEIYKDGSVTQRASDAGYALLDTDGIDFDATTGIHGISVNLADNTTAGFYAAGSQYWVVVASVTVDAATVNFVLCTFRIGYQAARLNTTIATLASQTSFTLTAGPEEDDALNNFYCVIHDVASAVQQGHAIISDYTGSTKTVTLAAGTTFTAAATDNISIMGPMPMIPTVAGRTLDVTATGAAGLDWANVEGATTAVSLTNTTVATVTTATTVTNLTNAPTAGDLTATMKASINTEADTALTDIHLDHLLAADYDPAAKPGVATALMNELIESNGGVSRYTAAALAQAPSGTGASAASIADAVWDELQADHVIAGSFGETATEIAAILVDTGTTLDGLIQDIPTVAEFNARTLVSAGYASPTNITAGTITTATNVTNVNGLAANVITAAATDAGFGTEVAAAVWDRVLTGGTHNIANSAGRRLRTLQTGGNYEGGMVWVDTLGLVSGTVVDENGVVTNPVNSLADARTLAAAIPLKALHVANGSTITLASATTNFVVEGHEWILALGGQDIGGTAFMGANAVTGISSGTTDVEFEDCIIGNGSVGATLPPGTYIRCGFNTGSGFAFTGSAAGRYVFVDCYSNIAAGGASTPFFVFTGASTVMFRRYSGGANITCDANTAALTYECLGGGNLTVALAGADLQVRGTIRDMTLTGITSASLVEFVGTIGNLSLAGADGTVTLDGIVGAIVDSRTGGTLNLPVNTMGMVGNVTGNLSGSVGSVTGAVGSVTGNVGGNVTGSVGSVTGNVGGNVVGSVASVTARVTANTDQINSIATAAVRLGRSTQGIVIGTVGAASSTTSIVTSALDPAAAVIDQYKGRIVTFDQGTTTANLRGQSTDITANTAPGVLTVTALTTAPVSGDTFTIT